ncbi:Aste57867_11351 [Aphanomyces stellatus]|uniref:Aste57867_11351 protein n=1 Tax=Aphanomyces stellatus TaxID=120398 RepID=A0A485KST7_9STRA|nr:hypothetical protein As57867_011309 [Aphanomyces stellatus]VFT88213.1 Aste57867_11351 [Aphanomyces stellatus]
MHQVEDEYAQDDIEFNLSFENAELEIEAKAESDSDPAEHPSEASGGMQGSLRQVMNAIQNVSTESSILEHLLAVSNYIAQLESKVQDLTVQNAKQTIDLYNLRQLYRTSLEENESMATSLKGEGTTSDELKATKKPMQAQLQEYMELDMEVHKAKQDKDKLATEHERVVALCAQFQQEVMWRNIDVAEGEKRLHVMTAQLEGAKMLQGESQRENADLKAQVESLLERNQTLQKHKKVLVHEVKALQKFSHVNIAGLEQDAQEARMMQKSLAMQLECVQRERDELKGQFNAMNIAAEASAA